MIKHLNLALGLSLCAVVSALAARTVYQVRVDKRLELQARILADIRRTRSVIRAEPKFGQIMHQARLDVLLDNL